MNDERGITPENLRFTFPQALRENQSTAALSVAVSEKLAEREKEINRLRIYARIDELPEDLLDILAYDNKVDWWDPNYSLEEKRRTLKEHWYVHRTMGTKAAIERAISAIYPETTVEEWFEYGGEPYHFRILIDSTFERADPEKHARVLERVQYYKNLRSTLDGVEYYDAGGQALEYACAAVVAEEILDGAKAVRY